MVKKKDKFAIAEKEYYAIFGDDADRPSRDHSAIDGTVVTLIPDDEYGLMLAMFIVKDGKAPCLPTTRSSLRAGYSAGSG
jgi:hypothetical protein